ADNGRVPRPAAENGRAAPPRPPGRPPLPQRRRQQNLVPQLRSDRPAAESDDVREDSPEQARARLSAFQQGTRRAREADPGHDNRYGDRD
ncbi:histidine kinase, partial [Amycolatopsis rubida]|nr:histidine kinase [Amycolatopsis rubida]NEC61824.1 histidine kinase [Amycolatopsis rubida]